jgi:small subunit ribosomal protein S4
LEAVTDSLTRRKVSSYPWLEWDTAMMAGKFMQYPEREMIPENINEQLIVELYSK